MRAISPLPLPTKRALRKLGQDIKNARIRRRIPMKLMAEKASISRTTLTKVEKGDPAVALGIYATILFVLGFTARLSDLADVKDDSFEKPIEEEYLPKRIRSRKHRLAQ